MPAACPVCGTPVVQDEGAVRVLLPEPALPGAGSQEFGHFVGRGGMDIEGAGWAVLSQLLERGMVKRRGDFFRLTVEDLESLDRFARKSAENLHAGSSGARGGRSRGSSTASASRRSASRPRSTSPAGSPRRGRPARGRTPGSARGRAVATSCDGSRPTSPERFEEVEGIGPTVAAALGRCFGAGGPARRVLESSPRPASSRSVPACRAPAARRDGPARRQDGRRHRHARGLQPRRRPRRRSAPPAASPPARCRRRPTTSSPARAPARSSPRPRSWAYRSSTRTASRRLLAADDSARHRGEP